MQATTQNFEQILWDGAPVRATPVENENVGIVRFEYQSVIYPTPTRFTLIRDGNTDYDFWQCDTRSEYQEFFDTLSDLADLVSSYREYVYVAAICYLLFNV